MKDRGSLKEIVVLSGKGGTGKTSITAALATLLGNSVVVDCDVDAANLHLLFSPEVQETNVFVSGHKAVIDPAVCNQCGLCLAHCRFDAIHLVDGQPVIKETSCDGCQLCARVCPEGAISLMPADKSRWYKSTFRSGHFIHARLQPGEENSGRLVRVIREAATSLAIDQQKGIILLDGPPGTGCPVISSITGANIALVVTEASKSGLHDLKRILSLVAIYKLRTFVVINKYDLNQAVCQEMDTFCEHSNVPIIGKIPFDPDFVTAMIHCQSLMEWAPASPSAHVIREAFQQLVERCQLNVTLNI